MTPIKQRYLAILDKIRAAEVQYQRPHGAVKLVAVSKKHSAESIRQLLPECTNFAENYLQEALEKKKQLPTTIKWHFIGPIQSNKTRSVAEHFNWVHSVDRLKIARRLNEQRATTLPPLNICLQLNLDGEVSKSGFSKDEVKSALEDISNMQQLKLRGFMVIPAPRRSFTEQRDCFRAVKDLFTLYQQNYPELDTLSMGMSADYEAAIAEGATIVRIGSDIFGARI